MVLMGYAIDGRGFAYVGIPPLFIGEATMLAGIGVLILHARLGKAVGIAADAGAVGVYRCSASRERFPISIPTGIDALRDGAIYYYGAFAFVVAGLLIADPRRLVALIGYYRKFARAFFLLLIPLVAVAYRFGHEALRTGPAVTFR